MREKPESSEWYYFKAGSNADMKAGPLSWERLCTQARDGIVEPDDVVWDPGFGWRKATQVPGLIPPATPAKVVSLRPETHPETLPVVRPPKTRRRHWRVWLGGGIALVIVAAVLGVYFGLLRHSDDSTAGGGDTATTQAAPVTTTAPVPTTTSVPPTTTAPLPVRTLGEAQNGDLIKLRVGDRVRIELEPKATSGVRAVEWEFLPVIVRKVGSGTEKTGDRVVKCWLELEAMTAGPVTVRAHYTYEKLTKAPWACYLLVKD